MKVRMSLLTSAATALVACTGELGAEVEPASEPGVAAAALAANCSVEDWRSLDNARFYAHSAISDAHSVYSSDHPIARRYFGEMHQSERIDVILGEMADVSLSNQISFACESEDSERCDRGAVLWVSSDEWVVHACGRRFWEDRFVNGQDSGMDASQVGIMVHEIAHLTGVTGTNVPDIYGEDEVVRVAGEFGGYYSFLYADSYRFYVMRHND